MQSLLPKDDEPIKPVQPQQQPNPQMAPPQGYYPPPNYPPPNYPPPQNYPPQGYAPPQPQGYPTQQHVAYVPQPPAQAPVGPAPSSKIPLILGAALVLVAAFCVYLYVQLGDVRTQMADTKESLLAEIEKIHETSSVTNQSSKTHIDALERQLAMAKQQAQALSGQAKVDAEKHADEVAAKLEKAQAEQGKQLGAVQADVSQVKDVANATSTKVGEVTNDVGSLKTQTADNKSQIEKTIADLKTARGDLGVQSGLIATNAKELTALRQLGERNYIDFKVAMDKHKKKGEAPGEKVGDIRVVLEQADPKKNTFSIKIIADDKTVEKKGRTINEPMQILLSKSVLPYELVVNDVKKDLIIGYLSVPKVQQTRAQAGSSN